nr:hypothetical protein CFP56_07764 [Quercus suber]
MGLGEFLVDLSAMELQWIVPLQRGLRRGKRIGYAKDVIGARPALGRYRSRERDGGSSGAVAGHEVAASASRHSGKTMYMGRARPGSFDTTVLLVVVLQQASRWPVRTMRASSRLPAVAFP